MTWYVDEIMAVSENDCPVTFEDNPEHLLNGKRYIFASPTVELSESRYRSIRGFIPRDAIENVKNRRIELKSGSILQFLTDWEIEHGALRGIGKVVWAA
jgi:hypothetical protein